MNLTVADSCSLLEAGIVSNLFHDFDDVIHNVFDAVFDDELNAYVDSELFDALYDVSEFVADIFDVEVNIRVPISSLRSTQCSQGPLCLWQC